MAEPPTPMPTAEHGPWMSEATMEWWVIADAPADALARIAEVGDVDELFPVYFGWTVKLSRCAIRWADDYNGEEVCIDACMSDHEGAVEAWHVTWEGM
jgi:hypothetical protein